ncbi:long-chain-fatty-acid--CoA ligase [Shouchella shacheensis]|uniref:long-chain-fatty-acid--CoA ligase n=1 Tax=Shouchella shacheensis TaxID=1649580 RepID=UPI0007400885|nr:long-chain fatty acid--CoA ligase [Shouchella shacheensis]
MTEHPFVHSDIEIPEMSLNEMLNQSVRTYTQLTAMTFAEKTFTYAELDELVKKVASGLVERGIGKGDKVALMLPNCPQYPVSYYAALRCGATIVQINPMYKPEELLHVLTDAEVKAIIILETLYPVLKAIETITVLETVIQVSLTGVSDFDQLLATPKTNAPDVEIDPRQDVAVIQYTGGTTGRSKGAMLTHYNLVANTLQSVATASEQTKLGEERVLTISPLFHVYGMTSAMNVTFHIGGNLILVPRFEVAEVAKIIENLKPTTFPGVPTMYMALLHYYKEHSLDFTSLRSCTSGSAPLPVEVTNQFNTITGTTVAEGFGLSEASPVTHRNPVNGVQKAGSIGVTIANTEASIVDIENGDVELAVGEVGELRIRGPQIMKGYYKMPEETMRTLQNGWLYTGDLARVDEDGYYFIVGRKKDLILASGFNVYPIEVEDVLYRHPDVMEAAVIGVPDSYRGETVKAVIVRREGAHLSEEDVIAFCREKMATYKVPTKVSFISEMPKTAVGKILKRELVKMEATN